jgi:HEAT repeat protein
VALWAIAKHRAAIPALLKEFEDRKSIWRFDAAGALWSINRHPAVLPMLKAALSDKDEDVRLNAILIVRDIGPAAKLLGPDLEHLLKDSNNAVRESAQQAIKEVEVRPER